MPALVASAPGRVNLIGEHTDYNGGLCLPARPPPAHHRHAHARATTCVLSLSSAQEDDAWEGSVEDRPSGWAAYVAGVVCDAPRRRVRRAGLRRPDRLRGPARGRSVELRGARVRGRRGASPACSASTSTTRRRRRLADACIRAENDYVGAPTGGMDQTVAMLGEPGFALLLDFADGSVTPVALPLDDAGSPCSSSTPASATASPTGRTATGVPSARRPPRRSGCRLPPRRRPRRRRADGRPGAAPARPPRGHREPAGPRRRRGARAPATGRRCRRRSTRRTSRCATTSRSPAASSTSPSRRPAAPARWAPG